ncbi:hypothetical protein [Methanogenium cariaci]|uniref:hypothetical protein n=1 Tax=Methanogenium cariaci TaxID=2197 RepID=UPI0012F6DB02|nr:hypothetical protein [Methanogenium cariaci]
MINMCPPPETYSSYRKGTMSGPPDIAPPHYINRVRVFPPLPTQIICPPCL